MKQSAVERRHFIFAPINRVSCKKFQSFLIRLLLSAINQWNAFIHCLTKNSKSLVSIAIFFKLGAVPAVFIVVGSEIHPAGIFRERFKIVIQYRIQMLKWNFSLD